jgi:hypothetical protein
MSLDIREVLNAIFYLLANGISGVGITKIVKLQDSQE